ncbi:hypothetical protein [Fimbriiglobus ruber]|uniref:Uncharacterized protein n=1 Tax=Fimbriiglobus ruber TaxID=1908690 RepID=A0A225DML7_9BACT|nr:hypothetical protein [Fimbriiglobus ruber]OWK37437.1 hypothetical protein FRUB_06557 [Fimbriiglobus ruber]
MAEQRTRRWIALQEASASPFVDPEPTEPDSSCNFQLQCPGFDAGGNNGGAPCGEWFCPHCHGRFLVEVYTHLLCVAHNNPGARVWIGKTDLLLGRAAAPLCAAFRLTRILDGWPDAPASYPPGRDYFRDSPGRVLAGYAVRWPVVRDRVPKCSWLLREAALGIIEPYHEFEMGKPSRKRHTQSLTSSPGGDEADAGAIFQALAKVFSFPDWVMTDSPATAAAMVNGMGKAEVRTPVGRSPTLAQASPGGSTLLDARLLVPFEHRAREVAQHPGAKTSSGPTGPTVRTKADTYSEAARSVGMITPTHVEELEWLAAIAEKNRLRIVSHFTQVANK